MAWLSGWQYRKSHVVNAATGAGSNYQVKIIVHKGSGSDSGADVYTTSHCADDFSDIRFTTNDGSTELSYWIEPEYVSGDYGIFWVKITDSLESVNRTIYMYYGKTVATTSNGSNTFIFFDNHDDSSLTPLWWATPYRTGGLQPADALLTESDSAAIIYGSSSVDVRVGMVASNSPVIIGAALECYCQYGYNGSYPNSYRHIGFQGSGGILNYEAGGCPNMIFVRYERGAWLTNYTCAGLMADQNSSQFHTYMTFSGAVWSSWIRTAITWTSANVTLVENGSTRMTINSTTCIPVGPLFPAYGAWHGGGTGHKWMYVTWNAVRKFVDNEPAHSTWGDEETEGGGVAPLLATFIMSPGP